MNAMVVGGYQAQMRGQWADAMRQRCGIQVSHHYCADTNFKGMPSSLPQGVDVVLIVAGTCSHKASEKAKAVAQRAGVRCETVSKDTVRTLEWLRKRGYQVKDGPLVLPSTAPVLVVEPKTGKVEPLAEDPQWLDKSQINELLPGLATSTFYQLAESAVRRDKRLDKRLIPRVDPRTGKTTMIQREVMVWTLEEVTEIERLARERGILPPSTQADPPKTPPVSVTSASGWPLDPPMDTVPAVSKAATPWVESLSPRAREHYLDDAPDDEVAPQVVEAAGGGLDDLLAALSRSASGVAKAAVRERDEWKAKAMKAEAELESLRQQLARIKSALGV